MIYPIPEGSSSEDTAGHPANESEDFIEMFAAPSHHAVKETNNTIEFSPVVNKQHYSRLDESSIVEANARIIDNLWVDSAVKDQKRNSDDDLATFRNQEKKKTADQWELMLLKQKDTHEKLLKQQAKDYNIKIERV